jgi:hypothetical protein
MTAKAASQVDAFRLDRIACLEILEGGLEETTTGEAGVVSKTSETGRDTVSTGTCNGKLLDWFR